MTHPFLPTRNSGLRVFSAAILSALLIVMPFVQLAAASQRDSRVRGRSPESVSQAKTELKTGATAATADNLFVNAPIPKPAPEPPALLAPSITATKVDSWDDTASPDGKVDPGQVITYTVTINNGGPDPATGVTFNDSVDTHTTLVPGSVQTQPLAIADTASAFGNVRISTANGAVNLLANDCDPDDVAPPCNDNLTASGPTTSTQNGNVVVNADGTFEYNPFPGFTGTDTFTYTIRDRGPNNIANDSDDATDTAVMTITVGPTVIWFINNSAAGGGDGRFTSPFNSIAAFNAGAADDPGDIIFIYFGTGANYTGGLTLLNNQKVIGQGFLLQTETGAPPAGSDTLPAAGSSPTIDNAGANIITLSSGGAGTGNTLRGFNTGNSGAAGTDISGTTFGTLTVSNLSINGDGRALNLTTGTLAASVANILASNTGANDGVTLNAVGGSLTVSTNTTITNPGGDGIDISNAPASTGYNFGTANVSKNAAGAGVILATNNASTTTSFTSLTITNSVGICLSTNAAGTVNVTTGSISGTGTGTTVTLTNTVLGMVFTSISSNTGAIGIIISGGSGSLTSGTTNLQNNAGIGLMMSSSAVVANFGNTTVNSSAGDAVDLSSNTGNITFADLDMTPDSGLRGLDAQGNTGTLTVTSGDVTTSGAATASAVFIDGPAGRTPINITLTSITTSGVGNTTTGASVSLIEVSGTKFQVTGTTQVNTRAGHGVFVDNSTPTTIQFATTNIPNVNNAGGDGIHIEDTSSAVTVSSATINNSNVVTGQTDGNTDFIPDNDGDGNAIFLRGNASGSFTLNGGTLSNCGNDCIDTRDSQNLVLSGVTIQTPGIDGGAFGGNGGHGIQAINLTGTNSITNSTITDWEQTDRNGMRWINHSSTAGTLTVHGSTFSNSAVGDLGIFISGRDAANMTANIGGAGVGQPNTFSELDGFAILSNAGDNTNSTATVNLNIINNTFTNVTEKGNNAIAARNLAGGKSTIVITGNTMDGGGRTTADTAGMIDIGGDALNPGNFLHFTITNNIIRNIGDNIAGSCGGLPCTGKRGIDIFIDDNTVLGNDTAAAVDADDDVVIDGNVITNVQRNGIIFDVGSVYNGGNMAARITNNRVGIRADNTIDRVGIGVALAAGGEHAIRVENRGNGATPRDLNILIQNNLFYNGNGGAGSALNNSGMLIRSQGVATMASTVANNTFNVNTSSTSFGINASTVNGTTNTHCLDASGNTITAPGAGFGLTEATGTLNIEQASSAALTAANGGATVSIVAGTPSFGVACATPPAAFNMLRPEPREYVASATTSELNSATAAATTTTAVSQPSLSTLADNTVTSLTREVGTLIPTTIAVATTASTQVKSEAKAHNSASDVRNQASEVHVEAADARAHHAKTERAEARRTESDARAHHANTARTIAVPVGGGGTVNINIGTLPANDSVTITFQVTMDNPPNASPAQISNQGTVSGTNFSNVLTDDPSVGGASDPTVTLVDLFDSQTTLASNNNPANQSENITFTATVAIDPAQVPTPPSPVTPTGTVTFKSDGVDIPGCIGVALDGSAQAQCMTSTLTPPSHNITAVYSGDGNYDTSTSNTVAQVVVACVTNPVVNSIADPGDGTCDGANCTLREAVNNVCNGSTITFDTAGVFATPQTIILSSGELSVARNVTINAPDAAANHVTVSGGSASRVFNINPGTTVTLRDFTVTLGSTAGNGGGILNDHAVLILLKMTISGNTSTAASGGGIFSNGAGGSATTNLISTTISGNDAAADGGGINNDGTGGTANITLTNTTISGNKANGSGGGLYDATGFLTVYNSTFTDNRADHDNNGTGTGGGIFRAAGNAVVHNTIVAGNFNDASPSMTRDDVSGAFFSSSSFNLIGDGTGLTGISHGTDGNQIGTAGSPIDALLGPLTNNGGPTSTHALSPASPAVEAGSNAIADGAGIAEDQRDTGYPRKADSADADTTATVDIGAFELHPSIEDIANQNTNEDTPINFNFNIGDDTGTLITGVGGSVTATSSNTTLVPNANLVITDPAPPGGGVRNLSITPAANQSGTTTITVTVTATNGRTAIDTFDLNVTGDNDNPTLTNNTGLTVNEGSTGNVIDNTKLRVDDVDNTAAQITFTVGTAPANGTLKNNGVGLAGGGTFTQADIDSNLLTYDHNGSETTSDSFTFTVSDGAGGSIGSTPFNITVTPQNDAPILSNNTGTTVNEGSTANTITSAMLSVTDADNTAAQITFTVGTAPANGTLKNNGVGLAGGGMFTQQDINNNLLTYDHNGSETTSDSFTFTVSDGAGGTIGLTPFNITVTPQNDAPVVTTTVANLTYTENDLATAVDAGLTVTDSDNANLTGANASITTNFQSGQDILGWVDNNLADNITLDGSSTAQTIVLIGADTPANYQAALRAVTYQNSSENPSTLTRTVTFTVNDGTTTGQGTRNIDVNAANDNPTLTTNAGLTVVNGGTGTIDNTKLKVDDVDNTAAQITFTVGTAPTNGTLKNNGVNVSAGGTFTQADIDGNLITYTHNGTATTSDSFTFTVSDGAGGSIGSTTFSITIGSPNVSINDAQVPEPASGTIDMTFTVALAVPAGATGASVNFTTNSGSATPGTCGNPGADYVTTGGTVNFASGEQVKTINVPICSDAVADNGETFTVTLNTPVNATIADGTAIGTITANTPGTLLISELRTTGPGGLGDDFVEIYNNTNSSITVPAGGYGLFKKGADCNAPPVLIGTIPAATVIPARGHFLFVGSQYSLSGYPSGNDGVNPTTATGDATLTADIETDANVGLFSTTDVTLISTVNRLDAVGFGINVGGTCNLLREGSNLPSMVGNETTQHSFFRKMCDWAGGCTVNGIPKDTNQNSDDFWLADTAAITGRLGAPGPENLTSPIRRDNANNPGVGGIDVFLLASNLPPASHPNRSRDTTPGVSPVTFGTMTLRYRVTNNTGGPVTRLRYKIVDISTATQPPGPTADLRALTGLNEDGGPGNPPQVGPINDPVTCAVSNGGNPATPCTVVVNLTTLETPPAQPNGGGYNSTLSSGTITVTNPLTTSGPNQSILINFKLGVQKTGQFRFYIIVEALP